MKTITVNISVSDGIHYGMEDWDYGESLLLVSDEQFSIIKEAFLRDVKALDEIDDPLVNTLYDSIWEHEYAKAKERIAIDYSPNDAYPIEHYYEEFQLHVSVVSLTAE